MMSLKVFSGECCKCDVGLTVNGKDYDGKQLHTGDIVMISHGDYIGTDIEAWTEVTGLTVIVSDQYINYTGGVVVPNPDNEGPYVMGLKSCGFASPEWRVRIVKKYNDVIDGERWPEYGFNYRKVPA